jgi:hypothetical protein
MLSNTFKNLTYIGHGIKGLFSNRVLVDEKRGTIIESAGGNNSRAREYYNNLQPVSLAINKISQDISRILIELQDADGITIADNKILDKYYNFLDDRYGQNGISSSYQNLITQIVANLKLNNEYFLRIFYHKTKDVFLGIELIPSSLCIETISNEDGYIDQFEVLFSVNNRDSSQIFKRVKEMKHIKKASVYKNYNENVKKDDIDVYLIHYHTTNGIEVNCLDNIYDFLPSLRGVSSVNLIKRSLEIYDNTEIAIIELTKEDQIQRNTAYAHLPDQKLQVKFEEEFYRSGHPKIFTNSGPRSGMKNGDNAADVFQWISKNIDTQKDLIHYYNMRTQESQSILQYFGIPTRIVSTAGSAYNNLTVANEEYERNLLGIMSNIANFLTKILSIVSPNFTDNGYKLIINKDSSFLIRKERREDLEMAKEFAPTNEIREEYFDKEPVSGGDTIPKTNTETKQLTPEQASKQKRKMPHTGERIVKKTT